MKKNKRKNKTDKSYTHLTYNDRLTIERLLKLEYTKVEIAKVIGCTRATIYNELKRGSYIHHDALWRESVRYSPELAQERYEKELAAKGPDLKIGKDIKLADYIEDKILNEKYSPQAVLYEIDNEGLEFETVIKSVNTIYSYIRKGVFECLTMEYLPEWSKRKKHKEKVKRAKKATSGTSIEKRPESIDTREEFGNWEMDCVVGKVGNKKTMLVFTERKTRYEIIELIKAKNADEVRKALNRLEKKYGRQFYVIFKTITVDNGTEFSDVVCMEQAINRVGKRTSIFYCHPYSSFERGSNENQNKLVRRFFPKGTDFDVTLNKNLIKSMEKWMNEYPRRLFGGKSAKTLFEHECSLLEGI